jgi:hypothetical protein
MLTQKFAENFTQTGNYGFMLVLYVLCFVYLFYPNTEYVCLIFLMMLNIFYVLLFYADVNSQIVIHSMEIPMKIVIILWWLSLLVSNSWLINTYINLRKKIGNSESGIDIGDNNQTKKQILILLVCNIILFVFAHLLSIKLSDVREKPPPTKFVSLNTIKIITTLSGVAISSVLFYLTGNLSSHTKIITTQ